MKQDFTIWRNQILQNPRDISPLKFGISQDAVIVHSAQAGGH